MKNLDIVVVEPGSNKGSEIQSAINLLFDNGGGEVWLKNGLYDIEASIELRSGVSITGVRPNLEFTKNCPDLGFEFVGGSILKGVNSDIECFMVNTEADPSVAGRGVSLSLSNLGFSGFRKVLTAGARNHIGLGLSELRSLFVDGTSNGTSVTELAFDLINCQHVRMDHIKCYNVKRGLRFAAYHDECQPGNSVVTDFYAYLDASNPPEYGVLLEAIEASVTPRSLNLISFIRPQVNWFGTGAINNGVQETTLFWLKGTERAPIFACEFHGLNAEGNVDCAIKLESTRSIHVSISSILSSVKTGICLRDASYSHLVSLIPNVSIDSDRISWPSQLSGFIKDQSTLMPMGFYWNDAERSAVAQFDQTNRNLSHQENSGTLQSNSLAVSERVSTFSVSRTLAASDTGVIQIQNSSTATYTLPDATASEGMLFRFVKTTNNSMPVTVASSNSQLINGLEQNSEITSLYDTITVQALQGSWVIVSRNIN